MLRQIFVEACKKIVERSWRSVDSAVSKTFAKRLAQHVVWRRLKSCRLAPQDTSTVDVARGARGTCAL